MKTSYKKKRKEIIQIVQLFFSVDGSAIDISVESAGIPGI